MEEEKEKLAGWSVARERQGGIVTAPPRSCEDRKSCDGPSGSCTASDSEEWAITRKRRDERRRLEGKVKDYLFDFEELNPEEEKKMKILQGKMEFY